MSLTGPWAHPAMLTAADRASHHVLMTVTSERVGNSLIRDNRRSGPAAVAIIVAMVVLLVSEAVAAAAWHNPAYSYADYWVSDLGVPGPPVMFKGHLIHSPLSLVLNTGFVVNGALVILAGILLLRPRGQGRMPRWQLRLVIAYGLGLIMPANFHEKPDWMFPFPALGATLIMATGNIATFLTGRLGARLGLPTWLARTFTVLGAFGLISFVVMQVAAAANGSALPHNIGTLERCAAYPLLIAQFAAGIALLVESARLRRGDLVLAR